MSKPIDTVLSPQTVFCTMILYDTYVYIFYSYTYIFLLHYVFDLSMLQVRNFYSLFCLLTKYVSFYTHSSHFYPFQVGCRVTFVISYNCTKFRNLIFMRSKLVIMVRVNLEFHKKYFVMGILRRDGLNWLNWKSKDLIGRLWEVEGPKCY